jgi:hypothetical protein
MYLPSCEPFAADNTSEIKSLFVTVFKDIPLRSTYKPHQDNNTIRPEEIIFFFALRPFFERNLLPASIRDVRNIRKKFLDARLIEENINVDFHPVARRSD